MDFSICMHFFFELLPAPNKLLNIQYEGFHWIRKSFCIHIDLMEMVYSMRQIGFVIELALDKIQLIKSVGNGQSIFYRCIRWESNTTQTR